MNEDKIYAALCELAKMAVMPATAGQVALQAGLCRNTCKKYLDYMVTTGRVASVIGTHVNYQRKVGYSAYGECECGCQQFTEQCWNEERGYGALYRHVEVICVSCESVLSHSVIDMQD